MPCSNKNYLEIMRHYDACLQQHGDTARGADWPNETDRQTRFSVMLGLLEAEADRVDLLDVGRMTNSRTRHLSRRRFAIRQPWTSSIFLNRLSASSHVRAEKVSGR